MGLKCGVDLVFFVGLGLLKSDQNGIEIRRQKRHPRFFHALKSDQNGIEIT